jgi:tRNA dimethylallyltransferase
VLGPTAVGKTTTAILLAKHYHTEIISGDSRQFYKELTIGTAKPTETELAQVPHHFINSLAVTTEYSAGDFERDALKKTAELFADKQMAVLCGGSGLFIKALCYGLDDLPVKDEKLRQWVIEHYQQNGLHWLQHEVARLDPDYFTVVDTQNPNRLMRALEVCMSSGKPYSSFRKNLLAKRNFIPLYIGLTRPRAELYERINQRVDMMVAAGLEQEAKAVYPYRKLGALKTVGYTEWFDYFEGKMNREQTIDKIKQHSRNYAKKQLTWFTKQENVTWFHPGEEAKIISHINHQLNIFASDK